MDEAEFELFLEAVARAWEYWVDTTVATVADPLAEPRWTDDPGPYQRVGSKLGAGLADLRVVVAESSRGLLHSVLYALDEALRSTGAQEQGDQAEGVSGSMPDRFVEHLFATGRLS